MSKGKSFNVQDQIFNQARKTRAEVNMSTVSDRREFKCRIRSFDMYSVLVQTDSGIELIYKHDIASVKVPEELAQQSR